MGGEVIFEKRYPKAVNDTLMAVAETMVKDLTGDPERREARLGRALADRVLVPPAPAEEVSGGVHPNRPGGIRAV